MNTTARNTTECFLTRQHSSPNARSTFWPVCFEAPARTRSKCISPATPAVWVTTGSSACSSTDSMKPATRTRKRTSIRRITALSGRRSKITSRCSSTVRSIWNSCRSSRKMCATPTVTATGTLWAADISRSSRSPRMCARPSRFRTTGRNTGPLTTALTCSRASGSRWTRTEEPGLTGKWRRRV